MSTGNTFPPVSIPPPAVGATLTPVRGVFPGIRVILPAVKRDLPGVGGVFPPVRRGLPGVSGVLSRGGQALVACAALLGAAAICPAQFILTYDAASGQPPQGSCWVMDVRSNPPATIPIAAQDGALAVTTTGLAAGGLVGASAIWYHPHPLPSLATPFAFETRVRVDAAPDFTVNPAGNPRPGYSFSICDAAGRLVWVGLGANSVFLSNTFFGTYGSSNTVHVTFNTTDAFHMYRLEPVQGGVALRIDGVQRLTIPLGSGGVVPAEPIYFGDGTFWTNSTTRTAFVSIWPATPCCDTIDFNNNGVFPEDQDVIDFLFVLAGGSCPTCNDIDFNNDAVFPIEQDVIDFFNVLAGGTCP